MQKNIMKVEGGKLVKVSLELEQGKIKYIKITGDFFMHPEEAIERIENYLIGVAFDRAEIKDNISKTITKNNIQLFGVDADSFAEAITGVSEIIPQVRSSGQSPLSTSEGGMISEHVKNRVIKDETSKTIPPSKRAVLNAK